MSRILVAVIVLLLLIGSVQAVAPVANFTANITAGDAPLPVRFDSSNSTGTPTGWAWFFGDEPYTQPWTTQNASSGWTARYGQSSVALPDGSVVLMGGQDRDVPQCYNDTWISPDNGKTWTRVNASSGWQARYSQITITLPDGSIVLMGGSDESSTYFNDVWKSADKGYTWSKINSSPGWAERDQFAASVSYGGVISLTGGTDLSVGFNDTWESSDGGVTWHTQNASSGWIARYGHSMVTLPDGSLALMGGQDIDNNLFNDTWRSTDSGATWIKTNDSPGWVKREGQLSVPMTDNSIILYGGMDSSLRMWHDAWRSSDGGYTWSAINTSSDLPDRAYLSGAVTPNASIVLMGGLSTAFEVKNNTWIFSPAGSTVQNPVHTYTANGTYNVTLQAYNADGYNTTLKSGYIQIPAGSSPTPELAMFSFTPATVRVPNRVNFTDASTGATSWDWNFGDGTANVTNQSPSHQYLKRGVFPVHLYLNGGTSTNSSTVRAIGWSFFGFGW